MLSCAGIRRSFGGLVVLDDVSLSVRGGEILGVAGPNGAGKTTLFDVLSGHVKADAGSVEFDGRDVTHLSAHRRARLGLGRTFQSPLVPAGLTVGETLAAARVAWSPSLDRADVRRVRELVRLQAKDEGSPSGFLGALDRRKLLLACLLMRRPRALLLDEPCSGLLQSEIDETDEIIRAVQAETDAAVVVVEHRLELLLAVAERVIVLDEGRQIAEGPPAEIFADPAVRAAYFEPPAAAP